MNLPLTPLRFLERAKTLYGKKEGIICGAERFTYTAFFDRCCRLTGALSALGLQPGDRVAFLSYNCHRLLESYYGVLLARGVLLPLNIRLSPAEIAFIVRNAGVRVLFLDKEFLPLIQAIQTHLPPGLRLFLLEAPLESMASAPAGIEPRSYDQLLADSSPASFDFSQVEENSLAELFYTSGTSGDPKGVMLSHRTVYLHALNTLCSQHLTDHCVYLQTIPMFHANGWGTAHTVTAGGAQPNRPRGGQTQSQPALEAGTTAQALANYLPLLLDDNIPDEARDVLVEYAGGSETTLTAERLRGLVYLILGAPQFHLA